MREHRDQTRLRCLNAASAPEAVHSTSRSGGLSDRMNQRAVSAPKLLDSGSNLYLSDIDASRPGEALLGGSLGGQAVVFKLTVERP